jgi:hypothetical protein
MTVKVVDPGANDTPSAGEHQLGMGQAPPGSKDQNQNYGVLSPQQAQIYNQSESNVLGTVGLTLDQYNKLAQANAIPAALQQKIDSASNQNYTNTVTPDTWLDKLASTTALGMSLGVATAGLGSFIGPGLGATLGTTGGGIATGAITGAAGGALGSAFTGQNIGKGALVGGVTGGLAGGLNPALQSAGLSQTGAGMVSGAAGGALRGAITGNPLAGAISGGVSGGLSSANSQLGGNALTGALAGFGGGLASNAINRAITPGPGGPAGQNSMMGGGSINPGQGAAQNPYSGLSSQFGGLFGAGMGIASNNQQSNLQQNAYTTAGSAANYNPFNFNGLGGMGSSFSNGTGTLSAGGFNPAGFQGLTNTALGSAGQFAGGGLPQGVSQAGGNFMSALGGAQGNAGMGAAGGLGMFNQGANLVGGANGSYNSAYNNSLSAAQQALQQPLQQQYNALRNQQFETGMSGTSGGGLQTQAFATGMGQAELQAQQNAVSQANSAQGIALGYGSNLMNSGLNQFSNFNTQGAGFAGQGLNTQMGLGSYSPQLSSLYANLANTGVSGLGGVQGMDTQLAQLGLQGMQIGGNNMNNAARTQGGIAQNNNYTNPFAGYATGVNSLFGNSGGPGGGILGNLGSSLSSLFSGMGGNNNFNPSNLSGNGGQLQTGALDATAPTFDFSNIGNNDNQYGYSWDGTTTGY